MQQVRELTEDFLEINCVPVAVQIGDYLLTLPQQLEPFTSQDSPALTAALKHSHLPFPPTDGEMICYIPKSHPT